MMNIREKDTNNTLFVVLDKELKLVYFNRLDRSIIVEDIIKALEIENYINENITSCKNVKNCDININKLMINKEHIFIVEIKFNKKMFLRDALEDKNQNNNVKNLRSNETEYSKIKSEMERLKSKLNSLMEDNYRNNYERVLEVSMQLDDVINRYCMLVKDN